MTTTKHDENSLILAYRTGQISRGRFCRVARALNITPADITRIIRTHKYQHKRSRRARRTA